MHRRVQIVLNLDEEENSAALRDWLNIEGWPQVYTVAVFSDVADYADARAAMGTRPST
ncbi:MAG TPA: hypothetical protein VM305_11940 [Candidatus Limnocylindrales bacterium]|nr:hypothetical protein [Candidatus Limnocylindrales bacterium]